MLDSMTQRLSRIFCFDSEECLRDEAHRGVPDRMGCGLEARLVGGLQNGPQLGGRMNPHASFLDLRFVRRSERRGPGPEGSIGKDLDGAHAEPLVSQSSLDSPLRQ